MSKNVILLVMDTARASDTRYVREALSGSQLAKVANMGSDFSCAYSNSPWTLPSHTSIFTGTYTSKHGTHAGYKSYDGQFPTIAELLSEEGYETVGITNNAWVTDEFGLARGFDKFFKVWQYVQTGTDFGEIKLTTHGVNLIKKSAMALLNGNLAANIANTIYGKFLYRRSDYGAARTNSLIQNWINKRDNENPFFLFVNYLEPHLDYQPPKKWVEQFLPEHASYEDARDIPQEPWQYIAGNLELSDSNFKLLQALYRAEIAYLDHQIGELREILENHNEWDDTVFIVVGDHGENIGDHGLMDHQYSVHDTLLHVPLIIKGYDFGSGIKTNQLIQTLDLFPTILDIAGVSVPSHSQGISFHPNATDQEREHIFAEYCSPQPTIERLSQQTGTPKGELKKYDRKLRAIRTDEYKLIRDSTGKVELFDLSSNTHEQKNIVDSHRSKRQSLESDLDLWIESFDQVSREGVNEMSESTKQNLEDLGYLQ